MKKVICVLLLVISSSFGFNFSKGVSQKNLLGLQRDLPYGLPKKTKTFTNADTIYIVAFRVQFREDSATVTTGTGEFSSDTDYYSGDAYKYDKKPHHREYFLQHLEFLKNYYYEVSDGRLVIQYEVYPKINDLAYTVSKELRDYNPWEKKSGETYCEFGERKADSIMKFFEEAIDSADNAGDGPFNHPFNPDKTVYLLIHAGASALTDGGYYQSLGESARDTPADLFDFFISQRDIQQYLKKDYFPVAGGRIKITELMTVSETANQDSVNFGINGILVNQFARQLGVPDLFGVSQCAAISTIGSFCIMDVAGYNNGMGFIPPYPSAWARAFLGWTEPVAVKPGVDSTYEIYAANLDTINEILQIPLNENEYLLIENRQRNLYNRNIFKKDTIEGQVFNISPILDSLVVTQGNSNVVISSNNYDAGLPGSGLLVWHVDESIIRSYYEFNAVNFDSSRRGIRLIEADGIQDIGVQFSNIFGTPVQDYGQPSDIFPFFDIENNRLVDSVPRIYTNDGGLTHISIGGIKGYGDADTLFAEGHGKEEGRRIVNFRSKKFSLRVGWGYSQGNWPQPVDSGSAGNHLATLNLLKAREGKEIVSVSSAGKVYCYTQNGEAVAGSTDTLFQRNVKGDTVAIRTRSVLVNFSDSLLTPVVKSDTLIITGERNIYRLYNNGSDSLISDSIDIGFTPSATPLSVSDYILIGGASGKIYRIGGRVVIDTLSDGNGSPATCLSVSDIDADGTENIIAAHADGMISCFNGSSMQWTVDLPEMNEPGLAVGNIDNSDDGKKEIAAVGKSGKAYLLSFEGDTMTGWPVTLQRKNASLPALADMDKDGYLDIIVCGTNRIYALDRRGNFLPNWPVILSNRESQGEIICSPSIADVDGDSMPEIVFGFGHIDVIYKSKDTSSNATKLDSGYYSAGNVMAIKTNGGLPVLEQEGVKVISAWPFTTSTPVVSSVLMDDIDADGALEIAGASQGGWIYAWNLVETQGKNPKVFWNGGHGNYRRTCEYADSLAPSKQTEPQILSIQTFYCYPNPAVNKNQVTLRYKLSRSADKVNIKVYDSSGEAFAPQIAIDGHDSWNRYGLDISNYPSGVYRAKITAEYSGQRVVKFCKFAVIK